MKVTISKTFNFEAAHCLDRLPTEHKCSRMHGHSYSVTLDLRGELDARGFVIDYDELVVAWQPVHDALDHRVLNEVPGLAIPSTEVVAAWIGLRLAFPDPCDDLDIDRCRKAIPEILAAVRVHESVDTEAIVTARDIAALAAEGRGIRKPLHGFASSLALGPSNSLAAGLIQVRK